MKINKWMYLVIVLTFLIGFFKYFFNISYKEDKQDKLLKEDVWR